MSLIATVFPSYTSVDLGSWLTLGETLVTQVAIGKWGTGFTTPVYWVYFGIVIMLLMTFCSASWVVYSTVEKAVSTSRGFYFTYADYSSIGNQMFLYEIVSVGAFMLWSLIATILALIAGSMQWEAMDKRVEEGAETVLHAETVLTYDKGMKHFFLSWLAGISAMITGVSLAEAAASLIAFFDEYDDDTNSEASEKGDSSNRDAAGTSAQYDILYHLLVVFYGYFVLSAISYGGYIFMMDHTGFDDDFTCEFESGVSQANYAGAFPILLSMKNYDDCMTKIDQVFPFFDDNNDGFISRCEDAQFQYTMGESKEFAMKFSAPFTKQSFTKVCGKRFPDY